METKTFVGIKLNVEGVHYFPKADQVAGFEVGYLQTMHRHNFGIECKLPVNHDNRDVEFIMLKHRVEKYLYSEFSDTNYHCLNFKSMSCEMIAKELLTKFGFCYVKVDEDGENYAEVSGCCCGNNRENKSKASKPAEPSLKKIVFVIGKFCSGKSYYKNFVAQLAAENGRGDKASFIEIGDVVRSITKSKERVFDNNLDNKIIEIVKDNVNLVRNSSEILYIVGIRQLSVFLSLYNEFVSEGYEVFIDYLPTSREQRKTFFENQKKNNSKKNDEKTFEEIEEQEKGLGIDQLCSYLVDEFVANDNFSFININNL